MTREDTIGSEVTSGGSGTTSPDVDIDCGGITDTDAYVDIDCGGIV